MRLRYTGTGNVAQHRVLLLLLLPRIELFSQTSCATPGIVHLGVRGVVGTFWSRVRIISNQRKV